MKTTNGGKAPTDRRRRGGLAEMPMRQFYNLPAPDISLGRLEGMDWSGLTKRAKGGDVIAGKLMLLRSAIALRALPFTALEASGEEPIAARVLAFVSTALESIACGTSPATALYLKPTSGSKYFLRDDWIRYFVQKAQLDGDSRAASYRAASKLLIKLGVRGPRAGWNAEAVKKIVEKKQENPTP